MKLEELRKQAEEGYLVDLVHYTQTRQAIVLMDNTMKTNLNIRVNHYFETDTGWKISPVYNGADYTAAMVVFQKCLNEIPYNEDGLKFVCPECEHNSEHNKLECCEDGSYSSVIDNIDHNGDFDYGNIIANGMVERVQCSACGYVLKDDNEENITDNEAVVEWVRRNCSQE